MSSKKEVYWAGVDWGDKEHAVCVVTMSGEVVYESCISHSASGITKLLEILGQFEALVGIAIETSRHVLVDALLKAGITVYPVNPKQSHQWRLCESVSGAKNDRRDAQTLAQGLRLYANQLRPLQPEQTDMRVLAMLCEQEQKLIERRSGLVNALKAALKAYYPGVLPWFSNWAKPAGWKFLQAFSTPEALAGASKQRLCGWFKTHRFPLTPERLERIDQRRQVLSMTADPATHFAHSLRVTALVRELLALQVGIDEHRKQIENLYAEKAKSSIFSSLPGAGRKLAPRLMSMFGSDKTRYQSADNLCKLSGTVPVEFNSGGRKCVVIRRACKKHYRNTLHQFAWTSIRYCTWARAYYDKCKRRKQSHSQALRNLATKWLHIIFRMWQEGTPYDDRRYLEALQRSNSPLVEQLKKVDNPVDKCKKKLDLAI